MKTFLFATAFGIATLLTTTHSASACHHYGCSGGACYPCAPQNPTGCPGGNCGGQTVNGGQQINNGGHVNNGSQTNNGGQSNNSQAVEWDLPAAEKARIRAAAKGGTVAPKPNAMSTSGRR